MTGEKISLCCITGNCEVIISKFIGQFRPLVDEICIVRAIGNQKHDGTLRKALAAGCRVGEYFNLSHPEWPHVDDFAAARNVAWAMASHEWVMWADIDDNITEESIREFRFLVAKATEDIEMIRCAYVVPDQGISENIRERIVRRGKFKWVSTVHECLKEIEDRKYNAIDSNRAVIEHSARADQRPSCERNIRILESLPENQRVVGTYFYLFREYCGVGRHQDAIPIARQFMKMPGAGDVEKYEVLLMLSHLANEISPDNTAAQMASTLHEAHMTCPDRAEALYELANLQLTWGNIDRARAYCRQMLALPKPQYKAWNILERFYGWAGAQLAAHVERAAGRPAHADALEYNRFKAAGGKISLLHATRGRPIQASKARLTWLQSVRNPDSIEHIFAIDADDEQSKLLKRFRCVELSGEGGCVEAWNAAAQLAHGEIFVQVSDDWIPPQHWDEAIIARIGPTDVPKVLAINDGHRKDKLLCMAILTRARWQQQGFLFHPDFSGVYSDNWFSRCAYRDNVVVEARDLEFTHCHPAFGTAENDETYMRQNSAVAYAKGRETFERLFKIEDIPGWYNYSSFYGHIAARIPEGATFVEIGCWKGKSICDLALRLKARSWKGRIAVVDTFLGEVGQIEHEGCGYFRPEFERNIEACGVADMIEIIEGDSAAAASAFEDNSVWFAYIDAAHDYESVCKDIRAWWPKITEGGILAGHDMQHWEVKNAVTEMLGDKAQDAGHNLGGKEMNPLLSILIPTVPERLRKLADLLDVLIPQTRALPAEFLVLMDNQRRSIGLKRNALLEIARGKYVAFCDDDDMVADDYCTTLCDMARMDVDVLCFQQKASWNGEESLVDFHLGHPINGPFIPRGTTKRFPWHICAWRRELAQQCVFTDKQWGEDFDWVRQAEELAKLQAYIPKVLHFYSHTDEASLAC